MPLFCFIPLQAEHILQRLPGEGSVGSKSVRYCTSKCQLRTSHCLANVGHSIVLKQPWLCHLASSVVLEKSKATHILMPPCGQICCIVGDFSGSIVLKFLDASLMEASLVFVMKASCLILKTHVWHTFPSTSYFWRCWNVPLECPGLILALFFFISSSFSSFFLPLEILISRKPFLVALQHIFAAVHFYVRRYACSPLWRQ